MEKAKEIFLPDLQIDIKNCGGKNELQKLFKLFAKTDFDRFNLFFVFDCDAKGNYEDCKAFKSNKLTPYLLKKNPNNNIKEIQKGIENAFNSEVIEQCDEKFLFSITEVLKDGELVSRERKLRKENFETFILQERNEDYDFNNFRDLFQVVEKKVEANQVEVSV